MEYVLAYVHYQPSSSVPLWSPSKKVGILGILGAIRVTLEVWGCWVVEWYKVCKPILAMKLVILSFEIKVDMQKL